MYKREKYNIFITWLEQIITVCIWIYHTSEPEFLNFEETQESIPSLAGRYDNLYSYSVPSTHRLFKNSSTGFLKKIKGEY